MGETEIPRQYLLQAVDEYINDLVQLLAPTIDIFLFHFLISKLISDEESEVINLEHISTKKVYKMLKIIQTKDRFWNILLDELQRMGMSFMVKKLELCCMQHIPKDRWQLFAAASQKLIPSMNNVLEWIECDGPINVLHVKVLNSFEISYQVPELVQHIVVLCKEQCVGKLYINLSQYQPSTILTDCPAARLAATTNGAAVRTLEFASIEIEAAVFVNEGCHWLILHSILEVTSKVTTIGFLHGIFRYDNSIMKLVQATGVQSIVLKGICKRSLTPFCKLVASCPSVRHMHLKCCTDLHNPLMLRGVFYALSTKQLDEIRMIATGFGECEAEHVWQILSEFKNAYVRFSFVNDHYLRNIPEELRSLGVEYEEPLNEGPFD